MIWEKKKILEHLADEYLHDKYPEAEQIHLKEYKKVAGSYKPLLQKDYGMSNDCTLTALTTIIAGSLNEEPQKVYDVVEKYAKQYGFRGKGTLPIFIKNIFDKTLKEFGVNRKTKSGYLKCIGYDFDRIRSLIDSNIPMVLSINKDGRNYYNNHSITIIGYLIYQVDNAFEPMLLVYDNWNTQACVVDYKALSMISSINYMG